MITPYLVCLLMLLLCGWKTYEGLRVINLIQGGYRDMMGCFFFGCGFIFRQFVDSYRRFMSRYYTAVWTTLLFAVVVFLFSKYQTANMNWRSNYTQFLSFIFHIVSYKVVSLLKIWYYGLDPRQIGCHMVIHDHSQQDLFWILYTIAGVGLPLGATWLSEKIKARIRGYRASAASQPQ